MGAFPFPRCGTAGLDRADRLMRDGWSVLLFPEGTRSPDGRIHEFKRGAARLAARRGATIVPVGIAGSREVLGKGAVMPRRRPVAVVFGDPLPVGPGDDPGRVTRRAEAAVRVAAARAAVRVAAARAAVLRAPRRSLHARVRGFAGTRPALLLAFGWGAAEALVWPIVPDLSLIHI